MTYRFKLNQEACWFVGVAVVSVLAQELLTFDGNAVIDWRVWAVALASALVRAAAGGVLAWIGRESMQEQQPTLADEVLALSRSERLKLLAEIEQRGAFSKLPPTPRYG